MAKDKKGFVLYCDLIHTIEKMPPEKAGELFLHILKYVNDLKPETNDLLIQIAFEPIKRQLKRDLLKYSERADRARENGRKGGRPKNLEEPKKTQSVISEPRKPDTVTVTVTDTVINKYKDEILNSTPGKLEDAIEGLYKIYPSKCPIKNRSLGKNKKDKLKIEKLLRDYSAKELKNIFEFYIQDCNKTKTMMKNLSTFLNNLPEPPTEEELRLRNSINPEQWMPVN